LQVTDTADLSRLRLPVSVDAQQIEKKKQSVKNTDPGIDHESADETR
jgi:hypothetical protein